MDQDIKASTALLILLLFGGILYAKFWASSSSKSIRTFSYLHQHPDGSRFILLDDQLFGFDSAAQYTKSINLSRLNVQQNTATDFAFFSNGDVLLRQRTRENNVIENLQRYFRFTNPTSNISADSAEGLFRCNPETYKCQAFSEQALNLNDAFSLAIDWVTDRVFVADSSRHRIEMYASNGEFLEAREGFRFPNQIEVTNHALFVADTNHHRIIALDISDNQFGAVTEEFTTINADSAALGEIWPSAFILLDQYRWVINNTNGMNFGGIYIFDQEGETSKKLALPEGADPFAIMQLGEMVLVSDFSQDQLYQFNQTGEPQDIFNPPVLQAKLKQLQQQRAHYDQLNDVFSITFAACLLGGFLLARHRQNKTKLEEPVVQIDHAAVTKLEPEPVLKWVKPASRIRNRIDMIIYMSLLLFIVIAIQYALKGYGVRDFTLKTWWLMLCPLLLITLAATQLRRRIGITENTLIIRSMLGVEQTCLKRDVLSSDVMIIAGKSLFQVEQLYQLFSANDVEKHLYPAFKQGKQVDRAQMQAALGKNIIVRFVQTLIVVGLVGLFIYYGIYL